MKCLHILGIAVVMATQSLSAAPEPNVQLEPFEPPTERFFDRKDKFRHPTEVVGPKWMYTFPEMKRMGGLAGEAVVLVEIDGDGFPKSLFVLYGTHQEFSHAAVSALKRARWQAPGTPVWCYYKARFEPEME